MPVFRKKAQGACALLTSAGGACAGAEATGGGAAVALLRSPRSSDALRTEVLLTRLMLLVLLLRTPLPAYVQQKYEVGLTCACWRVARSTSSSDRQSIT